jgi:hypothetical protein
VNIITNTTLFHRRSKEKQHLNIFEGGVTLGYKMLLSKVLSVDTIAEGNIKVSKSKYEDGFTKYKNWFNVDFQGSHLLQG